MTLKDILKQKELKGSNVKIGTNKGSSYVYCGKNNLNEIKKVAEKLLDREVMEYIVGVLQEEQPCKIIRVQGNDRGKYWTIAEYQKAHNQVETPSYRFKKITGQYLTMEEEQKIFNLYRSGHYSQRELCVMFNISLYTKNRIVETLQHSLDYGKYS